MQDSIYALKEVASPAYKATRAVLQLIGFKVEDTSLGAYPNLASFVLIPPGGSISVDLPFVHLTDRPLPEQIAIRARRHFPVRNEFICLDPRLPQVTTHQFLYLPNYRFTIVTTLSGFLYAMSRIPRPLTRKGVREISEPAILAEVRFLLHELKDRPADHAVLEAARSCLRSAIASGLSTLSDEAVSRVNSEQVYSMLIKMNTEARSGQERE